MHWIQVSLTNPPNSSTAIMVPYRYSCLLKCFYTSETLNFVSDRYRQKDRYSNSFCKSCVICMTSPETSDESYPEPALFSICCGSTECHCCRQLSFLWARFWPHTAWAISFRRFSSFSWSFATPLTRSFVLVVLDLMIVLVSAGNCSAFAYVVFLFVWDEVSLCSHANLSLLGTVL